MKYLTFREKTLHQWQLSNTLMIKEKCYFYNGKYEKVLTFLWLCFATPACPSASSYILEVIAKVKVPEQDFDKKPKSMDDVFAGYKSIVLRRLVLGNKWTPLLNRKNLSNNSTWDFEPIFDTRNRYGLCQGQNFVFSSLVFFENLD